VLALVPSEPWDRRTSSSTDVGYARREECLSARKVRLFSDTGTWKQTALRGRSVGPLTAPNTRFTLLQGTGRPSHGYHRDGFAIDSDIRRDLGVE